MEQWFIASKRADFNAIAEKFHVSPVLARLMRNRDIMTDDEIRSYLSGSLKDLPSPHLLKDADKAADIMIGKIKENSRIRIISDYDVDGVSSNYILWKGLKRCGADVDYRIPDRIEDGYGINKRLITNARNEGIDTIITCDNGIAALEQIDYANELGMTVIVTDHHEIPYEEKNGEIEYHIPKAVAVVNPKQKDCSYPYKNICGAVVAYKFMQIMYEKCGVNAKEMQYFLPMAALATVCDVMPLRDENRILVKEGLKRMQDTDISGLRALIEANGLLGKKITGYHLGFVIGPCINASGRLKTAQDAMELLACEDWDRALKKAYELTELNKERKELTKQGVSNAMDQLQKSGHSEDKVLIIYLKDCHESIAGIIAGRVREHYNKPVFVLTKTDKGIVKGSGRSIEAYHMFQEMTKVKDCFLQYGGHPMAAGLSMEEEKIDELRRRMNENTSLSEKDFIAKIHIDIQIPLYYLSEYFIQELSALEPFGTGNEKPLFAEKNLQVCSLRILGNTGRCVKLNVKSDTGIYMEAMYFGESQAFMEDITQRYDKSTVDRLKRGLPTDVHMHVTYFPKINEYRGNRTIQIVIQNYILC